VGLSDGSDKTSGELFARRSVPMGKLDAALSSGNILDGSIIRKLTPIECERLQSLPDNYTEGISNSQRYKCLGNAFNKEVVKHILKNIKGIAFVQLDASDVVRHRLVKDIIKAYEKDNESRN
jgi:site-specific DNA-cytosine methylase